MPQYPIVPFVAPQAGGQTPTVPYGDAGIGGVQGAPNMLDWYRQVLTGTTGATPQVPGANVPYIKEPTPNVRMPVPMGPVPTNQPTQISAGRGASLEERRTAKQQGIGNLLGNMVGMVVNQKEQEKIQSNTATIKDYIDALNHRQEAQRVLQADPNNAQAKQVLAEANRVTQKIENDNKQWKVIQKSIPNYIDPSQNNTPEVKAGNAARTQAADADVRGLNNDTAAQQAVSAASDQLQAKGAGEKSGAQPPPVQPQAQPQPQAQVEGRRPLMTQPSYQVTPAAQREAHLGSGTPATGYQPRASLPQGLAMNPAYEAQQKYEQKMGELAVQHLLPRYLQEQGLNARAIAKNATDLQKEYMRDITAAGIQDSRASTALQVEASRKSWELGRAQIAAGAVIYGKGSLGGLTGAVVSKQLSIFDTSIQKATAEIKSDEDLIYKLNQDKKAASGWFSGDAGKARAAQIQNDIDAAQARMEMNRKHIKKIGDARDKFLEEMSKPPADNKGGAGANGTSGIPTPTAPARPMADKDATAKGTFRGKPVLINPSTGDAYDADTKKYVGNAKSGTVASGPEPLSVGPMEDDEGIGIDIDNE